MNPIDNPQPDSPQPDAPLSTEQTTPVEVPAEEPEGVPAEAPSEAPESVPTDVPAPAPAEAPAPEPSELPSELPSDNPEELPEQTPPANPPSEAPAEEPAQTPAEAPPQAPAEAPAVEAPAETPSGTPAEAPPRLPQEAPADTPAEIPAGEPESAQAQTSESTGLAPEARPAKPPGPKHQGYSPAQVLKRLRQRPGVYRGYLKEAQLLMYQIRRVGLGPALAILLAHTDHKNKRRIYWDLSKWVFRQQRVKGKNARSLMESLIYGDAQFLLKASHSVTEFLETLYRLSQEAEYQPPLRSKSENE